MASDEPRQRLGYNEAPIQEESPAPTTLNEISPTKRRRQDDELRIQEESPTQTMLNEISSRKPHADEPQLQESRSENKLKWEDLDDWFKKWVGKASDIISQRAPPPTTVTPSSSTILPLLPFQREFVNWAIHREVNLRDFWSRGGILLDEMGLGKMIQAIALVLTARDRDIQTLAATRDLSLSLSLAQPNSDPTSDERQEDRRGAGGTTLVVCQCEAAMKWVNEIHRSTEGGSAATLLLDGDTNVDVNFHKYDFMITTYDKIDREWKFTQSLKVDHVENNCKKTGDGINKKSGNRSLCHSFKWKRVILDELSTNKFDFMQL